MLRIDVCSLYRSVTIFGFLSAHDLSFYIRRSPKWSERRCSIPVPNRGTQNIPFYHSAMDELQKAIGFRFLFL